MSMEKSKLSGYVRGALIGYMCAIFLLLWIQFWCDIVSVSDLVYWVITIPTMTIVGFNYINIFEYFDKKINEFLGKESSDE